MIAKNPKIQNTILALIIISVFLPSLAVLSVPNKSEAAPVSIDPPHTIIGYIASIFGGTTASQQTTATALSIKEAAKEVARQLLMTVARKALQQMTKSTINWINTGHYGNPLFLENPKSFFKDIAKYEIKTLIDVIGYDARRFPFGKAFALNTIDSYKRQLENNLEYSLNKVIKDPVLLASYRNDFRAGGWNAFLLNTQFLQNNPIGFNMLATEELGRRLADTNQNNAQKVKTVLDQGMGFLSPQTCPSNPAYNNTKNQFQQPKWNQTEYYKNNPYEPPTCENPDDSNSCPELRTYQEDYDRDLENSKYMWEMDNTCPGGLVNTTPGSVVASQITNAMGTTFRNTELAAAMGNSLSAIFDALLNKFIGTGLNSLASKTNKVDTPDDWDFYGNTLGSGTGYRDRLYWDSGPDEEIVVGDFKRGVDEGIRNTQAELAYMSNLEQMLSAIWPKVRELDICLPGPDMDWENRLQKEADRNSLELQEKGNDDDGEKAARAQLVYKSLLDAVNLYKDWVKNKMLTALPSSVIYQDAIDEIETIYQQSTELTDRKRERIQALARLTAIKNGLDTFTDQPEPDTEKEKELIEFRKQYNATRDIISNTATIDGRKNELSIAQEKLAKLNELIPRCEEERVGKGWTAPSGRKSELVNGQTNFFGERLSPNSNEQELFCEEALRGGQDHESFINPDKPYRYPDLYLINAEDMFPFGGWPLLRGTFVGTRLIPFSRSVFGDNITIELECSIIYRASILDYKRNIPGLTTVQELPPDGVLQPPPPGGQCTGEGKYEDELMDAMNEVLDDNPDLANSPNTVENQFEFLDLVADNPPAGFNMTDGVLNGFSSPNRGDLLAIWRRGDSKMERYDVIESGGAGNQSLEDSIQAIFVGLIPLNCTDSGGGRNCADPCLGEEGEGGSGGGGGTAQCPAPAENYSAVLEGAMEAVLEDNPDIANSSNTEENQFEFLDMVSDNPPPGYNITDGVLNGFSSPNRGDLLAIWRPGDTRMERYDVIASGGAGNRSIEDSIQTIYTGSIPLNCTDSGGGRSCACSSSGSGGGSGGGGGGSGGGGGGGGGGSGGGGGGGNGTSTPTITSVSPTTARPGATTITISGTNLTTTVQFFDRNNISYTTIGTVNSGKTQTSVLVPAELPTGSATVRVYLNSAVSSNSKSITISTTGSGGGGGGGTTSSPTPVNATAGWDGGLAYNTTDNNWLIVSRPAAWGDNTPSGGIQGVIMKDDGTKVSGNFRIDPNHAGPLGARVAYAKDINKYLVTWVNAPTNLSQMYGRFVSANGTPEGSAFLISGDAGGSDEIKYDSKNKRFVIVWSYNQGGTPAIVHSYLTTVSSTGGVGPRIKLTSNDSVWYFGASVAINEATNEYCVAYGYNANKNTSNIGIKKISASTMVLSGETFAVVDRTAEAPRVAYNSVDKKYLLVWQGDNFSIQGKTLNTCSGTNSGNIFTVKSDLGLPSLAYNSASNTYGVIGINKFDNNNTYVILNSNNSLAKSGSVFSGGNGNYKPAISANGSTGKFGLISSLNYGVMRFLGNIGK